MRVAPVGLFCRDLPGDVDDEERAKAAFELGCAAAAITHGHPLGYLPAGFLSSVIFHLVSGRNLEEAVSGAMMILVERPECEKSTLAAMVSQAIRQSRKSKPCPETIELLGGGWVGDEALAISLYCAFAAEGDFARGVRLAVNHSGDSDSTGAITGNILGAMLGKGAVPREFLEQHELRELIEGMGKMLQLAGK